MLRAVAEQRSVELDAQGVAVVAHRIADLILRLEQSALDADAPVALPAEPAPAPARKASSPPEQRRRASLTEEDDAPAADSDDASDSEASLTSEETAETDDASLDDDARQRAAPSAPASSSARAPAPMPVRRMQAVPVLPRGGGLALKVGPPALPLLRLLLQQIVEIHAARSAWEAYPIAAKRAHLAHAAPLGTHA